MKHFWLVSLVTLFASNALAAEPTDAEKALAASIDCKDFKPNPDGSWLSGPTAKLGSNTFSGMLIRPHGINIMGADAATVLNQKCGAGAQ
jgi:hypothetical protein